MTDQTQEPEGEMVCAAHILEGVSQSISTDGEAAIMVFKIADGSKFAVTIATGGLKVLRAMVSDLIAQTEKRQLSSGMVTFRRPAEISIGHSNHIRGCSVISFDPGKDSEIAFVIPDQVGMAAAEGWTKDILSRMTESDRRKMMTRNSIFPAGRPKLIVPGGQ
jgi:hypothetical protein